VQFLLQISAVDVDFNPCPASCLARRRPCSLRMYNSLVERCFRDCVESFRRKDLDSTEEKVRCRGSQSS
jgi:hypothetical protein